MHALLEQGGPALVGIVGLSLLAWMLATLRYLHLRAERAQAGPWVRRALDALQVGDAAEAARLAALHPGATGRLIGEALAVRGAGPRVVQGQLDRLMAAEAASLRAHLGLVGVIATLLPLLGLLGTVLGMMDAFGALTASVAPTPGALSGGVSQALVTTQAGLVLALPLMLAQRWLSGRAARRLDELALYRGRLEILLREAG